MSTKAAMSAFIGADNAMRPARRMVAEGLASLPRQGKLLYKLLAVCLSLAIIPLLLASVQIIRVGNGLIQKQIIGVKLGIAQKVAGNVTSYLEDKRNTLQIVQKSSDFLSMNPLRQSEIMNNVMNAYPVFMRMTVVGLDGEEISSVNRMSGDQSTDRATIQRDEAESLRSIKSMGDYMSAVYRPAKGYPQMTIGVPIEKIPGRPIGVLLGVINVIDLSSLVKDLQIDKMGYVYIVDVAQKQLIAHPDTSTLLKDELPAEVQAASLSPEDNAAGAIEFTDQAGHRFLAAYATVPKLGTRLNWRVFVQQPIEEAYQASKQMQVEVAKVLVLVLILTVVVGTFFTRSLVKRVHVLQAAMEQVGEGNFDVPQVPASNDEFGSLTEKFLWMARSLRDKTLSLVSAQSELQKWNSELETRVEERTRDLKAAQDQLIAHEKLAALGQMASVVGHELRNPLAVMNNSIYFIKTKLGIAAAENLDPKIGKHLGIIESEIVKSNAIIRDVLDFARNRALNAAPHRLDELVEKAIERIQIPEAVTLRKSLQLGALEVPVDEDEVRQVLVNLMENACQAMTSGGTLTVGTKTHPPLQRGGCPPGSSGGQGEFAEIVIGDTGCGIPQEHLGKIFAPFFTTKSRGTGLGLAVVKKIIERHQGTIDVTSKVGEGTQFRIRLPLRGVPQA